MRIPEEPLPAQGSADPGGIAVLAVLLLVVIGGGMALYARRRRSPVLSGTQTFDRVARLAARMGYAPRPSQTAYEYAGTLSDVVPAIRQELHVVAQAKVESTYARREPSISAVRAIADAYARIRRGLLRLFFRRRPPRGKISARPAR